MRRRRLALLLLVLLALAAGAAACRPPRPAPETWRAEWTRVRSLVPPASDFDPSDPRPLCERVLGQLREAQGALLPTPDPELDAPVERWMERARSVVYACPPEEGFGPALAELEGLAHTVDRELAAEAQGGPAGA